MATRQKSHFGQGSEVRSKRYHTGKQICRRCVRKHGYDECHLKNYFQSCCKIKSISTVDNRIEKNDEHGASEEEIFFHSVESETDDD